MTMHTCQSSDPTLDLSQSCMGCLEDHVNRCAAPVGTLDPDDIFVWADGTFCTRDEVGQYAHMSDDYEVLPYGSPQWNSFNYAADSLEPAELVELIQHRKAH